MCIGEGGPQKSSWHFRLLTTPNPAHHPCSPGEPAGSQGHPTTCTSSWADGWGGPCNHRTQLCSIYTPAPPHPHLPTWNPSPPPPPGPGHASGCFPCPKPLSSHLCSSGLAPFLSFKKPYNRSCIFLVPLFFTPCEPRLAGAFIRFLSLVHHNRTPWVPWVRVGVALEVGVENQIRLVESQILEFYSGLGSCLERAPNWALSWDPHALLRLCWESRESQGSRKWAGEGRGAVLGQGKDWAF